MSCRQIEEFLYDYTQDRLDEAQRSTVEAHLTSCPDCRENLRLLQEILPLMDDWQTPRLSPAIADRLVQEALRIHNPWWRRCLKSITLPARFMLPVQAVAAASVIIVIMMSFTPKDGDEANTVGWKGSGMTGGQVSDPVRLQVNSVPGGMDDLKQLIKTFGGRILRRKNVAMIVGLHIDAEQEDRFFEELAKIGRMNKSATGYKTDDGTLMVLIVE